MLKKIGPQYFLKKEKEKKLMPSQHAYSAVFLSIYPSMINHSTNQSTRIIRIYFVDVLMHPTSLVKNERKKKC